MFSHAYLYYYLLATFFAFVMLRASKSFNGSSAVLPVLYTMIGGACNLACFVFLVLGFWFMPHWWYPIVFVLLGIATALIPIPDAIASLIGIVVAPVFSVLMYLSMFGIL